MKKNLGFSSFEFYFVVSAIGLILIVGFQRYSKLAEETQRLSFEILAQNFSASIYSYRARWIMAQQSSGKPYRLSMDNSVMQFSREGWPLAVDIGQADSVKTTLPGCTSLWKFFLNDAASISMTSNDHYELSPYHVSLTSDGSCRFELEAPQPGRYYFEYSPFSGQVNTFPSPIIKNN